VDGSCEYLNFDVRLYGLWTLVTHDFNDCFLTFYTSLQITLNDFVITEVQLNLKPSKHPNPYRTEPNSKLRI